MQFRLVQTLQRGFYGNAVGFLLFMIARVYVSAVGLAISSFGLVQICHNVMEVTEEKIFGDDRVDE